MSDIESTQEAIESASSLSRHDFMTLTRSWIRKHGKHESDRLLNELKVLSTGTTELDGERSRARIEILESQTRDHSGFGYAPTRAYRRSQEIRKGKREAERTLKIHASPRGAVIPEVADIADIVRSLFGDAERSDSRVSWVDDGSGRLVTINNNELNVLKGTSGIKRMRLESAFYSKLDQTLKSHDITPGTGKGTYSHGKPQKHVGRNRLR